jgi:hypothetical protein
MPSPTSKPRQPQAALPHAAKGKTARQTAAGEPGKDVRTDARQARTREYMAAENKREAKLAKQGYWF